MMNRIDIYITRHVLGAIFIVMLVIVGLDLLFALVDQLPDLNEGYQFNDALYYVTMTAPRRIYEHIPLCSLIGCLLGLGTLATTSELTVMRAAGVSTLRIITAVMKPVMVIILLALALGEYVVPKTEQEAQSFRTIEEANGRRGASSLEKGVWHREGNTFLYVSAISPNGELFGLTRYQFDEDWKLERSSYAKTGVYTGGAWALSNIVDTEFLGDSTRVVRQNSEQWASGMTPSLLTTLIMEPRNLSISGLHAYSGYLEEQGLSAADYQVAFWSKVLQPLAITGLVLVAVSFIFGPLRSVTVGQRLIAGVIVGLVFKLLQDLLGPASTVYGLPPLAGVLLPIMLSFLIGWRLLRRAG